MKYDIFKQETELIERSAEALDGGSAIDSGAFKSLLKGYKKLLKHTRRLVRISDRSEEQLLDLTRKLDEQNKTLNAQNEELVRAAQMREDVERIMRHDLKSPLMSVVALPQLLKLKGEFTEKQRGMLDKIEKAGRNMDNMIESSLDMFKIEQGTYQLHPENIDLVQMVNMVVDQLGSVQRRKKLEIVQLLGEDPMEGAKCDFQGASLLCQTMIANLVRNAMEAAPKGGTLTLSITTSDGEVAFAVHNMGVVPEELRDTFFEKYATAGKTGGTGLGTYSARLTAEAHNGSINYISSEEAGTTVEVRLPL